MPSSLPPEILDLVVDYLPNEPAALKACCLVSKSWIQRTRKHIFAEIKFHSPGPSIERWGKIFPDPTNSPAHHTRTLSIHDPNLITTTGADIIPTFCGITHLDVYSQGWYNAPVSLIPLHGLSPILRSLRLACTSLPDSEVFGLICSFPLLEDLALVSLGYRGVNVGWNTPSTSPKLTGSLELRMIEGIRSTASRLLELPSGLHFKTIKVSWLSGEDAMSTIDLVSRCSGTLESLDIAHYLTDGTTLLDLSKVTKLQEIVFRCGGPDVQWIATTLHTVEPKNLQQISIALPGPALISYTTLETVQREWVDLDCLLVQFWTSHSLRPKVMYEPTKRGRDLRNHVARLLPELTRRGVIDLVEDNTYGV